MAAWHQYLSVGLATGWWWCTRLSITTVFDDDRRHLTLMKLVSTALGGRKQGNQYPCNSVAYLLKNPIMRKKAMSCRVRIYFLCFRSHQIAFKTRIVDCLIEVIQRCHFQEGKLRRSLKYKKHPFRNSRKKPEAESPVRAVRVDWVSMPGEWSAGHGSKVKLGSARLSSAQRVQFRAWSFSPQDSQASGSRWGPSTLML